MIPSEVADIADIITPDWAELAEDAQRMVLDLAWAIYNAGYRKQDACHNPEICPTCKGERRVGGHLCPTCEGAAQIQ